MHRKLKWIVLGSSVMLLTGCLNRLDQEVVETTNPTTTTSGVQTTRNQLSDEFYRAVIEDGRYQLASSASADQHVTSSSNMRAFEEGLLQITKNVFPTDQYFLREGQIINAETLTQWVSRESTDNPDGLNPQQETKPEREEESQNEESSSEPENPEEEQSESTQEDEENNQVITDVDSTPIYLNQILEKDIVIETEDGYELAGVAIGLSMNSVYSYTDSNGNVYEQEISQGELRERGKSYANIIIGRLRNDERLRSVPIVVGIFQQAKDEEVVGGTYVLDGISREGNAVSDWTELNNRRVLLPAQDGGDQAVFFTEFRNQVNDFFPNLNGVSAEASYIDNSLSSLNIEIITQFYQITEIAALTQHVVDVGQNTLPQDVPIEIRIISSKGTEGFVGRDAGEKEFTTHVFRR